MSEVAGVHLTYLPEIPSEMRLRLVFQIGYLLVALSLLTQFLELVNDLMSRWVKSTRMDYNFCNKAL